MKVLYVTHCSTMGGANHSMLQLIIELKEKYDVTPFVLLPFSDNNNSLKIHLESHNIEYIECDIVWFKQKQSNWYIKSDFIHRIKEVRNNSQKLRDYKFDIVHSNGSVINVGAIIAQELGIKHIWHLREFGELDFGLIPIFGSFYERLSYSLSDHFISISKIIDTTFKKKINTTPHRVIYNGIIESKSNTTLHNSNTINFICAGVVQSAKNQMEIALAINELVSRRGIKNIHLTLCGIKDNEYYSKIEKYIIDNQLGNYIDYIGEITNIENILSEMDVGVMSSKCEAFGRVTVEYMLSNLAVIANNSGANCEIIDDGINGLIYDTGNYVDLADKMYLLINDRNLLNKIALEGNKKANEKFLSKYNTESIYMLYEEVLSNPSNKSLHRLMYLQLKTFHYIIEVHIKIANRIRRIISDICKSPSSQ